MLRCAYAPVGCIYTKHVDVFVCVCMGTDVFILLETNVVLMLMRSLSSLAAGSGIEFLPGNRSDRDIHTSAVNS